MNRGKKKHLHTAKGKDLHIVRGSEFLQFIFMTVLLYAFWLIMSGHFEFKLMMVGFVSSVIVAWVTRPLARLQSTKNPGSVYLAFYMPYLKYARYWLWLFVEIAKANIYVLKLVLNPKMPIDPIVVTFKKRMANPVAHVTLANSITLTPGTITIAVEDDVYYVHAVTKEAGLDLAPSDGRDSAMVRRVAKLFGED